MLLLASFLSYTGAEWLHTRQRPSYVEIVPRPSHILVAILRGSGAFSVFMGVGGWWGALHQRHFTLCVFSSVIFLTSVLEISCGSVTLSYAKKSALLIGEDIVKDLLKVEDPNANASTDKFLELQEKIHCCGVHSFRDWVKSPWWEKQRQMNSNLVVPVSCCAQTPEDRQCNSGSPPYLEVAHPQLVHGMGCMQRVSDYMDFLFYTTGTLALMGGCLKFFGFLLMHILINLIIRRQQRQGDEETHQEENIQ